MYKITCSYYDTEKVVGCLLNTDGIAFSVKTARVNNPTIIFIEETLFTRDVYCEFAESVCRTVLHNEMENVYVENTGNGKKVILDDLYNMPEYDELI